MQTIRLLLIPIICSFVQACSSTAKQQEISQLTAVNHLYLDNEFNYREPIQIDDSLFKLSPEMEQYVDTRLRPLTAIKDKADRLRSDLFDSDYIGLTYNPDANVLPQQVFTDKQANCLSLAMLSYALASEVGLNGIFREVEVEENWRVTDALTTINNHVNLELRSYRSNNSTFEFIKGYVIDFFPTWNDRTYSKQTIPKQKILALFYNNLGAEALSQKNYELAYQYFKDATQLAPNTGYIWGNLASIYRQRGYYEQSKQVYSYAIELNPNNLNLKEGLAILYKHSGQKALAEQLYAEINWERKNNPYYFAMQAEEALNRGEATKAKALFERALKIEKQHDFYLGLAQAALQLNQLNEVKYYLTQGEKVLAQTDSDNIYAEKISALNKYKRSKALLKE